MGHYAMPQKSNETKSLIKHLRFEWDMAVLSLSIYISNSPFIAPTFDQDVCVTLKDDWISDYSF